MGLFEKLFGGSKNDNNLVVNKSNATNGLNTRDMYDICYALGCMVGFSALTDREERSSTLLVRVDREKMETSIYAHGGNWVSDFRNETEYAKLRVPAHIASYLTKVDLQMDKSNALTVVFNQAGSVNNIMQKIEDGMKLLPYQPGMCQLKSYPLGGNSNSMVTCIDLFAARD